jgi:predicted PurR-regulated permease PerM
MIDNQKKIEQIAGLLLIAAILVGCVIVLKPFIVAILWAAILCFATWPLYEILLKWLKGRRTLASLIMTILIVVIIFLPFFMVGMTFTESVQSAMQWLESHKQDALFTPPIWIQKIPLVGPKIFSYLTKLVSDADPAIQSIKPWILKAGVWLLQHSLDLAQGILQLAMSILIAFFLYRDGKEIDNQVHEAFKRITGDLAQHLIDVAKLTIRGVVYGIIGTALSQSIAAGIGFAIAGVPSPVLLAFFTFFFSFIPSGSVVFWLGAAIWLFATGHIGWGIFMIAYGILVISSIDNVIRTFIISRSTKLPFIIMFIGILGGITAFGLIGVFIGPTLLTVGYSLVKEILSHRSQIISTEIEKKPEIKTVQ